MGSKGANPIDQVHVAFTGICLQPGGSPQNIQDGFQRANHPLLWLEDWMTSSAYIEVLNSICWPEKGLKSLCEWAASIDLARQSITRIKRKGEPGACLRCNISIQSL